MIVDPGVFNDDHQPRRLQHREAAVETLSRAFEPASRGRRAEDALLTGPSGVGKTALSRHALRRLEAAADVDTAHVRTLGSTTGDVLREVLRQHSASVHLLGTEPVSDLVTTLKHAVSRPCIVVLDEADDLPETDVLDVLRDVPLLSVVAIAHDAEEWLAHVDEDFARVLTHQSLDRYRVDELADILEARAQVGLRDGVVTRRQLEVIADEVAGVAREGIQSLRAAAEIADEREHHTVQETDVADSYERARREIRRSNLASLPVHHQVLYALLYQLGPGEVAAGTLHNRYDALGDRLYGGLPQHPVIKRTRRNKLMKLAEYDLIETLGESKNRRYQVTDAAIEPALDIPGLEGSLFRK